MLVSLIRVLGDAGLGNLEQFGLDATDGADAGAAVCVWPWPGAVCLALKCGACCGAVIFIKEMVVGHGLGPDRAKVGRASEPAKCYLYDVRGRDCQHAARVLSRTAQQCGGDCGLIYETYQKPYKV